MSTRQLFLRVSLGLSFTLGFASSTISQITPNGAGTLVNPQGNQINITGGTQAGANLFHSFRDFNLTSSQIANFLSNPQTRNILARINGGNPSVINGLLQVTGGNSNLFLMNPSGIIFGANARLNIPASFTATTANSIGFGNNNLFNAFGDNNYAALAGNPHSFLFTTTPAGSVVNAGNLSVTPGQGISLIGGNVINTGNINAGNITLAAVPGTNRVRISQPGQLLSLEVVPPTNSELRAVDLPTLLTGSSLPNISTNGETVQVAGVAIPIGQGINITSGNLSTSSQAGTINILGDRVALISANLNASGIGGGGTIRVGGEYQGRGDNPFNSRFTYIDSNSLLNADATNSGNGGRVIVWADDTTQFYGNITARGVNGGFAEVSGKGNLAFDGRVDLTGLNGLPGTLLLDPTDITIQTAAGNGDTQLLSIPVNIGMAATPSPMTLSAGALAAILPSTTVDIQASNNITFNTSVTFAACTVGICGPISFTAGGGFITNGNSITAGGRNLSITAVSINAGVISTFALFVDGGAITLNSQGTLFTGDIISRSVLHNGGAIALTSQGTLSTGNVQSNGGLFSGNGGAIAFTSQGTLSTGSVDSNGSTGAGGAITLTSQGNLSVTGPIYSYAIIPGGTGGAIAITSQGNVSLINLSSEGDVQGGTISLTSQGNLSTNVIFSESYGGSSYGGNININAGGLFLATGMFPARYGQSATITSQGSSAGGSITITHGGSTSTPFVVGNATNNGTTAAITSAITSGIGPNTINNLTVPVPPTVNNYGTNISIRTTLPTPPPIPTAIIPLLINPAPPPTPAPVVVGTPPSDTPSVTPSPSLPIAPSPSPSVASSPSPNPSPNPLPSPISSSLPSPIPIIVPSPSHLAIPSPPPTVLQSIRTTVGDVSINPQSPRQISAPFSGTLTMISTPSNAEASARIGSLENSLESDFRQYLGLTPRSTAPRDFQGTQLLLNQITEKTRTKPALIYIFFAPPDGSNNFDITNLAAQTNRIAKDTDQLEAILVTGTGRSLRVQLSGATRRQVLEVARNFRSDVTNFRSPRGYLTSAQQMYQWILAPLEEELQKQGINNLVFLMDSGLRTIPLAAMHDGKGFIIERYSVGLMPSLNLTPLDHRPLEGSQVLAMGATTFGNSGLNPLPAVSLELNTISQLWSGSEFLNETFTLNNLIQQRQNRPYRMIHLATHGVFNPGDRSNSYIQFWDQRLSLDRLSQLNLGNPPVDLLVLSACQTAIGDKDAELGFAGLAINAGVRSALASLWEVNDAATLGLMTEFYQQLQVTTTKAEALRQAQLAMLRGEVRLEDGNLVTPNGTIPLTEELRRLGNRRLTHPYYWSTFTIVGNPW